MSQRSKHIFHLAHIIYAATLISPAHALIFPSEHFNVLTLDTPLSGANGGLGNSTSDASALKVFNRTLAVRESDSINVLDYAGLDLAATAAQSLGKSLRFPAGSHSWTSSTPLIISAPVIFEPGAQLTCNPSNVTFTNSVVAGRWKIFASGCTPSFWTNVYQQPAFPEWWGAVGNATGVSGVGTDSTTAFSSALLSGVAQISLAGSANYRWSTISSNRSHVSIVGADRGSTSVTQDDPTGLLDGLKFINGSGQMTIQDINFSRAQAAIGSVAAAAPVSGGSSYAVNDTITIAGGTFTTAAVLRVTSISSGVITGLTVQTPGVYTKAAPPIQTSTISPAVAQASTSGSGTGATFKLLWSGPALLRLQDTYFGTIQHNTFAGSNSWDQIRIEGLANNPSQIHLRDNQIFSANHDNIFIYGPAGGAMPGDIWIDNNYIQLAKYAGVEIRGYTNGIFETLNGIYNNNYGNYWDADSATTISSSKIRANDIDTNVAGDYYFGLNESHYQQNWHSGTGPLVCTSCVNIQGDGNHFTTSSTALYLNGSGAINFNANHFTGGTGPIFLAPYKGIQTNQISLVGNSWSFGGGYFLNWSGTPSNVTVGVVLTDTSQAIVNPSSSMNSLTIVGSTSPSNNANNGLAAALYGSNNSVGANFSAAGGTSNGVYGYGSTAYGANNHAGGTFSNVRGAYASDDDLFGADCVASGTTTGNAGVQQICHHVLRVRTTAGGTARLTSDGNTASGNNCLNLPSSSHAQFQIMISGYNPTSNYSADWSSVGPNVMSRGATASNTTYAGSFTSATSPQVSSGTGASATVQLSADTVNGCLNITVSAPADANPWDWEAAIVRLKMQ